MVQRPIRRSERSTDFRIRYESGYPSAIVHRQITSDALFEIRESNPSVTLATNAISSADGHIWVP